MAEENPQPNLPEPQLPTYGEGVPGRPRVIVGICNENGWMTARAIGLATSASCKPTPVGYHGEPAIGRRQWLRLEATGRQLHCCSHPVERHEIRSTAVHGDRVVDLEDAGHFLIKGVGLGRLEIVHNVLCQ